MRDEDGQHGSRRRGQTGCRGYRVEVKGDVGQLACKQGNAL